jgi:predicted site-specific integrase-resolvase
VVLDEKIKNPRKELVEDLLSITTVFSSSLYGMRRIKKTKPTLKTIKIRLVLNEKEKKYLNDLF